MLSSLSSISLGFLISSTSLCYYAVLVTLIPRIDSYIPAPRSLFISSRSKYVPSSVVSLSATSSKGFGATPSSKESEPSPTQSSSTPPCTSIYSRPSLYDMAFGYRNFEEEVDFLMDQHRKLNNDELPSNVLELAAGPARHCIEALKVDYIQSATAVDNSADMVEYAKGIAREELKSDDYTTEEINVTVTGTASNENRNLNKVHSLKHIQADMSNFTIPLEESELFDTAWILLGSLQHLTTNEQVISCFNCIHRVLRSNGTFILELPHPRETFSLVECTRNGWDIPLEDKQGNNDGELNIIWGDNDDQFDPITQVRQFTVSMELMGPTKPSNSKKTKKNSNQSNALQRVKEIVPMRHFTSQEIDLLARITGFEVMSMHGALQFDVDVNDDDQAFRLVCVLQKR